MSTTVVEKPKASWIAEITAYHLLVFVGCWLGGIFDGMDSSLYMVIQHDAIADVAHTVDRVMISSIGSHVMSIFLFGWVLGGMSFGVIADRFGRVRAMALSILMYGIFTGLAGFAHTETQLAICRFLTGFGIGGELVTIATMLSETWPESSRALAVGMVITSYQVGVFLAGLLPTWVYNTFGNLGFEPWRLVFFLGALPAFLSVFIQTRMEEPEKWKAHQAELKKHEAAAPKKTSGNPFSHLAPLFTKEHRRNVLIGASIFGGLLVGYWASLAWIPTWIQDLIGDQMNGTEKSIATMYHGVAAVLGCSCAGVLANTFGRRSTIIFAYSMSFVATCWLVLANKTFSLTIYWQDAFLGFFIGLSQAIMYVYLPELFPTRIRATAMGFCLNMGRFVTAFAVMFVGPLVKLFGGYDKAILFFSVPYLFAVIMGFVGRETKGETLSQ